MLFFEESAKTGDGIIKMFFGSFALIITYYLETKIIRETFISLNLKKMIKLIDFFNDKRKGDNNDELIKDLIAQNISGKSI